jgi:hypothetical protein
MLPSFTSVGFASISIRFFVGGGLFLCAVG